jgi:hypothetical protein
MKLELKAIKHSEFASQETNCFEAKLYVDGKPFAIITNDGWGGPDHVTPAQRGVAYNDPTWNAKLAEIEAFIAASEEGQEYSADAKEKHGINLRYKLESWCAQRVDDFLMAKDLKKLLRGKMLYINPKDKGLYQISYKGVRTLTERHKEAARKNHPEKAFLNDMPFDRALAAFVKAAA